MITRLYELFDLEDLTKIIIRRDTINYFLIIEILTIGQLKESMIYKEIDSELLPRAMKFSKRID